MIISQITTGAPSTEVTVLMVSSVGEKAVRAMRSQARQNTLPVRKVARYEHHGPGGAEDQAGDVGHGDAHKGDGAGKGGDAGRQDAGQEDQGHTGSP